MLPSAGPSETGSGQMSSSNRAGPMGSRSLLKARTASHLTSPRSCSRRGTRAEMAASFPLLARTVRASHAASLTSPASSSKTSAIFSIACGSPTRATSAMAWTAARRTKTSTSAVGGGGAPGPSGPTPRSDTLNAGTDALCLVATAPSLVSGAARTAGRDDLCLARAAAFMPPRSTSTAAVLNPVCLEDPLPSFRLGRKPPRIMPKRRKSFSSVGS
mmetsp:Transcript_16673/g.36535  ORF Transcript_16673/g.36535 Transcript_16673/m.36535 type:complete len:216 (+) Transcript_16673:495-1142(+)